MNNLCDTDQAEDDSFNRMTDELTITVEEIIDWVYQWKYGVSANEL